MWIAALGLMAFVMYALLRSLVGAQKQTPQANMHVSFYHAQIAEIDLQLKQKLISQMDAESAKAEAGRALLKAQPLAVKIPKPLQELKSSTVVVRGLDPRIHVLDSELSHKDVDGRVKPVHDDNWRTPLGQTNLRVAALAVLIAIPSISLPIYAMIGQPQTPDLPLAMRPKPDPAKAKLEELITQIEARLIAAPNDTRGMELIAPLYMRAARFDDAARILQQLNAKLGSSPARETDLGEALMMANDGIISVEAHAAFERALLADAKFNKARYYMGKAAVQDGAFDKARKIWTELAADMPQGALKTMVEDDIQKLK